MSFRFGRRRTPPRGFSYLGYDSEFRESRYWEGVVDAYIELISKGIRDVALPNFGVRHPDEVLWMVERVRHAGLLSATIRYNRIRCCRDGTTQHAGYGYELLIFHPREKERAEELRQELERPDKDAGRNQRIGQLFGYGPWAIEEFITRKTRPNREVQQ
jgi:hypothetical protein